MQLTLLVPELIWPEPGDKDVSDAITCPALDLLLARARLSRRPAQAFEATLAGLFGHPDDAPYAAWRQLGESAAPPTGGGDWLNADPVHLRFQQERLILADSGGFDITADEARTLAGALNDYLADDGRIVVAAPARWYLQLTDAAMLAGFSAAPLSAVAGRSIESLIATALPTPGLRRLHNEMQMLLHGHPLNRRREQAGQLPINGLWLWGGGAVPAPAACGYATLYGDNPLARGLAVAGGVPWRARPANAATLLADAAPDGEQLIVIEDLLHPVQYENAADYRNALSALEHDWFAPLRAALADGRVEELRIDAPTAYGVLSWHCRRSDRLKFWRRTPTLGDLAETLAKGSEEKQS